MLLFGALLSLDCFLYMFTILPLRVIYSLIVSPLMLLVGRRPHPSNLSDIFRAVLVVTSVYVVNMIDFSFVYHSIRAQVSNVFKVAVVAFSLSSYYLVCPKYFYFSVSTLSSHVSKKECHQVVRDLQRI